MTYTTHKDTNSDSDNKSLKIVREMSGFKPNKTCEAKLFQHLIDGKTLPSTICAR